MKDFFNREIKKGDTVALLQKSGSSSVYIREGIVTGFTKMMVKVKYIPQSCSTPNEERRAPYLLIKKDG